MKKRLLVSVVPALACFAFAAPALAATQEAVSENWAGYVASSQNDSGFSAVSGAWTQPKVDCSTAQEPAYSAYWVGLGGGGEQSQALEQIGTQADCQNGTASYYAWYELVPSAPVQLNLTIHPGDHISASVGVSGSSTSFSLKDETTGQSFSQTVQSPNPDTSSAEWIAEAPSQCDGSGNCTPLPLSDFGTVDFSNATATANGHTGPISDSDWSAQPIALGSGGSYDVSYGSGGNTAGATPSTLSSGGSAFSVSWSQNGAGSSSSQTSGSSGGSGDGGYGDGGYGYGGYPGGYGGYGGGGYGSGGYDGYGDGGYGYGQGGYGGYGNSYGYVYGSY
jgi:Peptidase A4 family